MHACMHACACVCVRVYVKVCVRRRGLKALLAGGRGVITLDGVAVSTLSARWLREKIAVVSQDPVLFGSRNILENIMYGSASSSAGLGLGFTCRFQI